MGIHILHLINGAHIVHSRKVAALLTGPRRIGDELLNLHHILRDTCGITFLIARKHHHAIDELLVSLTYRLVALVVL